MVRKFFSFISEGKMSRAGHFGFSTEALKDNSLAYSLGFTVHDRDFHSSSFKQIKLDLKVKHFRVWFGL